MSSVDNRVVNMGFNGSQFLSGVSQSIAALDKLETALQFKKVSTGIDALGTQLNKLDVSGIESSVDGIANRFSTLGIIGMNVLGNLTNKAVNAGMNFVKAFTITPAAQGFNEMELKMKSIQTILSNTQSRYGTTVDDVTRSLDELNTYADKTIYNFAEMTQNIGRFTTAGLDLDTSVSGIKGLANLGAFFNASSSDVNRAMYQISQALASGTIRLMDWNSMVNANMGGTEFTDDLMRVARKHGIAIDQMVADEGSFRETLQKGWLTNDIFLESLSHFSTDVDAIGEDVYRAQLAAEGWSDAEIDKIVYLGRTATEAATKVRSWTQLWDTLGEEAGSGWATTWETIFGNFEESTELFNGAYKMINPLISGMNDWRNNLLKGWKDLGGRNVLIDTVTDLGNGLIGAFDMVGSSFNRVFDIDSQDLVDATQNVHDFFAQFQLSEGATENLSKTLDGLFSIADIIGKGLGFGGGVIGEVLNALFPLTDGILDFTGTLAEGPTAFNEWLESSDVFGNALDNLHDRLQPVRETMQNFSDGFGDFIDYVGEKWEMLDPMWAHFGDKIREFFDKGREFFTGDNPFAEGIREFVESIKTGIQNGIPEVKSSVDDFFQRVHDYYSGDQHAFDVYVGNVDGDLEKRSGGFGESLKLIADKIREFFLGTGEGTLNGISAEGGGLLGQVSQLLGAIPWGDILAVIGVFGAVQAFKNLSKTFGVINQTFGGFAQIAKNFNDVLSSWSAIGNATAKNIKFQGYSDLIISIAVLIGAIAGLSFVEGLNPGSVMASVQAVGLILAEFAGLVTLLSAFSKKVDYAGTQSMATSFLTLSGALAIIAAGVSLLGNLDEASLSRGMSAMGTLLAELGALMAVLNSSFSFKNKGTLLNINKGGKFGGMIAGLLGIVASVMVLSKAVEGLGNMDPAAVTRGLSAVSSIMGSLVIALGAMSALYGSKFSGDKFSYRGKGSTFGAIAALVAIAGAVTVLADTVGKLGALDDAAINKGLSGISSIMLSLVGALTAMSVLSSKVGGVKPSNIASIVALVAGIAVLAESVSQLGTLSSGTMEQGIQGVAALGLVISGLVTAMSLVSKFSGGTKVTNILSLVAAVAGLTALADAVSTLGTMYSGNMEQGIQGIAAISVMLTSLIGALELIKSFSKSGTIKDITTIATIVATVGALKTLASAVGELSDIGFGNTMGAATGIVAMLSALAGGLALLKVASKGLNAVGLLAFGAFLGLLAGAVTQFSGLDLNSAAAGLIAMAGALTIVGVAAAVLGGSALNIAALGAALLIFSTAAYVGARALFVLAEAFTVLANLTGPALENLVTAIPRIAESIGEGLVSAIQAVSRHSNELWSSLGELIVGGIESLSSYTGRIVVALAQVLIDTFNGIAEYAPALVTALVTMLCAVFDALAANTGPLVHSIAGLVKAIAEAMGQEFGNLKWDQSTMDGIVKSMYEIFALIALMKFSGIGIKDAAKAMGELMLVFGPMVGLFALISMCADSDAVAALDQINDTIALITVVCGAFAFIPVEAAANAVVGLDLFIANLAVVLAALGALKQIPGLEWLVSEGGQFLGTLGEAIGRFIGGIGQGVAEQFSNSFGEIGTNLAEFAANASPFFDLVTGMDDSITGKMESFKTLIQTISSLGGPANYGSNKLEALSEFMPQLATIVTTFNENIQDINPENLTAVSGLLESLKGITEVLPTINPATGASNMMSLTDFANDLAEFATTIKGAVDNIGPASEFDTSGMMAVIDVARQLNDLQLSLPNINNGSSAWFSGSTQTLNSFAKGIVDISDSIKQMHDAFPTAEGFDISGINSMLDVVKQLAQVQIDLAGATTMGTSWFSWDQFLGLGEFGNQIAIFAEKLKGKDLSFTEFGEEGNFSPARARNLASMLSALAEVQVQLADVKTTSGWGGTESVQMLGGLVENIVSHIEDFKLLSELQLDEEAAANVGRFASVVQQFAGIFGTDMSGYNPENVTSFVDALRNISSIFSGGGELGALGSGGMFGGGVDFNAVASNIQAVAGAIPSLISAFDALNGMGGDGTTVGANIQGFMDGLERLMNYDFGAMLTNLQTSVEGVKSTIGTTLSELTNEFTAKTEEFRQAGTNMGNALLEGMNSVGQSNTVSIQGLVTSALNAIAQKEGEFRTKGENSGQRYVDGVASKQGPAADAASQMASGAASAAEGGYDSFYSAGANAAQGYVDGINSKLSEARSAAAALASVAASATNAAQKSHSPSRVFMGIGANAAMGYILGIRDKEGEVKTEAASMIQNALGVAYELSQRDMNFNPVIAPVYDGSQLDAGIENSDLLLRGLQSRALSTAIGLTAGISDRMESNDTKAEASTEETGTTIVQNFTQNNTSPKALSRLDIYKDTKTLFALAKEAAVK